MSQVIRDLLITLPATELSDLDRAWLNHLPLGSAPPTVKGVIRAWFDAVQQQKLQPVVREEALEELEKDLEQFPQDPNLLSLREMIKALPPGSQFWPRASGEVSKDASPTLELNVQFDHQLYNAQEESKK